MSTIHPVLSELLEQCVKHGVPKMKAHLAFDVYVELCEVQKLWQVSTHINKDVKEFYITAKRETNSETEVFVPFLISEQISIMEIEMMKSIFCENKMVLNLVIKDADSSTTFYKVTPGLISPETSQSVQLPKGSDNNMKIESQILQTRKKIYTNAVRMSKCT